MRGERTVLVLTHWFDPTADHVVNELNARDIPVFRCNPGDFPQRLTLTATMEGSWTGCLRNEERTVDLDKIGCVYYRRPTAFEFPASLSDTERRWAAREARAGFGGIIAALPNWLNHPVAIGAAEYKPVQLADASKAGLIVPESLITNDADAARTFVERVGRAIYKPLAGTSVTDEGKFRLIYTTVATADEIDDSIGTTAVLVQRFVDKAYEVRLTVVDNDFFAVRIDAKTPSGQLDWRTDYRNLSYEIIDTPPYVRQCVSELMQALNLRFGALDFSVTSNNDWVFLEINPNGQWAWIEENTQQVAAAIAGALTKEYVHA